MTSRYCITTEEHGFTCYDAYSDVTLAGDLESAVIARIVVEHGPFINSLTVHYARSQQPAVRRGGAGLNVAEVVLAPDEWITSIEGSTVEDAIAGLLFVTNKGKTWGPFGSVRYPEFTLGPVGKVASHLASRMGLLYFQGRCDGDYVRQLKATFAEYPGYGKPPRVLKFEKQTGTGSSAESVDILSTFARQLMSPIVILRIGPDNIQFRAYEDILCQLPFFRAALQGGFKEAEEKTITMPEDEPATIAALIEFLSTGSYTYTFEPQESDDVANTADIPVSDVTQGTFHVAVYATASKYGCENLVQGSLRNFTDVLKELKGGDVISLLKVASDKGLYLSKLETDGDLQTFVKGLQQLVAEAYTTHREEMESMVSDYPVLASDLLRLISISGGV